MRSTRKGRHAVARPRHGARPWIALAAGAAVLVAAVMLVSADDDAVPPVAGVDRGGERLLRSDDPMARACELSPEILTRVWRGLYRGRSIDVTMIPRKPNFSGGFGLPGHTGPWRYLQEVPLVLYGPERIKARGAPIERHAGVVDVYPTVGELLDVELEPRAGKVLDEALLRGVDGSPKLVLTIVWDGVGRNVLERWPDAWPNLARVTEEGTSYVHATVGSTPSITPATHSNLGTGDWPRRHGMTAIQLRNRDGTISGAFGGRDPRDLELTTFADQVDAALGNEPKVGMLAWKSWHLGMFGHGRALAGGDADQLALFQGEEATITGHDPLYSTPEYLNGSSDLDAHADDLDRADGAADGEWRGHEILAQHDNPAWVTFEREVLLDFLAADAYGQDAVPDLFFTNFKMTDIVGHQYTMDSPEMESVLRAQDDALGAIISFLDERVGDYVVIVTADHGHTPSFRTTGGWAIGNTELQSDIDAHFDAPAHGSLLAGTTAGGLFLDRDVMRQTGVTAQDIAEFLNGYTIADNARDGALPEGFEGRGGERVFSAAFPNARIGDIMECATGERKPPRDAAA